VKLPDNAHVVVGGMISDKTVKFTRDNKAMAFLEVEDLTGTVEVIVFPKTYERYQQYLGMDEKIFVVGRADIEEEQNGKLISERIVPFSDTRKDLWLQFATMEVYAQKEEELLGILRNSDGMDEVVIYVADSKQVKRLGAGRSVLAEEPLLGELRGFLGEENVKVVEKNIENRR
jgi:DNA polymerase-3 subunit alpha